MGLFEQFEARARVHAEEDEARKKQAKDTEPLIASLLPGRNYFTPREFRDLVVYLLEGSETTYARAMEDGEFSFGPVTVLRHKHADSKWLTASELAKLSGCSRQHMCRMLESAGVSRRKRGRKILYCFAEINELRANDTARESA